MKPSTRQDVRTVAGVAIGGYALLVVVIVALMAIGGLIWWITVLVSGPAGSGNIIKDQNDAKNREHWSATFNGEYQQIQGDQSNIKVLHGAATGSGATQQDRMNYLGAQQNCNQDVAEYNANANSTLASRWIPAGLPSTIDPTTYCGK